MKLGITEAEIMTVPPASSSSAVTVWNEQAGYDAKAAAIWQGSRFAQRFLRRYGPPQALLPEFDREHTPWPVALARLNAQGVGLPAALRQIRQACSLLVMVEDALGRMDVMQVCATFSSLAAFALEQALADAHVHLQELHGLPMAEDGSTDSHMWIVAMGKLGARELNASSDIDLIYLHTHDGQTAGRENGRGRISNSEYFAKVAKHIQRTLAEVDEHGFVFRIDLALRPNGNSGPISCSLDALSEYFSVQGREWERLAWVKSRVIAPAHAVASGRAAALRELVLPFVFRKYLDYSVFDALRSLHRSIREQASRRAAGRPQRHNDVKLSRGGIREIEFTVQLLQVVRGGHQPELRTRRTLEGLERLVRAGLMPADTAAHLTAAYCFLRQVEHRIQYLDDAQTHVVPEDSADLQWMAAGLSLSSSCDMLCALDEHRERVAQEFDRLLGAGEQCTHCKPKSSELPSARVE
jgi:[glutamine synthetase] adenylyltransferase / [glutamine synthetase]-adenylyl-L-tyrosine phosphorylase